MSTGRPEGFAVAGEVAVVVPVHDNLVTLDELHAGLLASLDEIGRPWRILYVDDASEDGSWSWIAAAAADDPRVHGVRLAANVGQTRAICVGFELVEDADAVATIDADLDFDPADLVRIVGPVLDGVDVAAGVRFDRTDHPVWRLAPSLAFNLGLRLVLGYRLGDAGCGYFAMSRRVVRAIPGAGPRRLAIRPLLSDLAGPTVQVLVRYRSRPRQGISARRRGRIAAEVFAVHPLTAQVTGIATALAVLVAWRRRSPAVGALATLAAAATLGSWRLGRRLATTAEGPLGTVAERTEPVDP